MKKLIDVKGVSEILNISTNTIYCWVGQRKIPYVKLGRLVKFDLQAIEKWVEEKAVPIMSLKERDFG